MIATTTSNNNHQQQHPADLSDTELDEFGESSANYHSGRSFENGGHANADGHSSTSFLMDKNKKLFPQKLWELINNPSIQHCLRWSDDGQRVYLNRNEFESYYLKTANNQFHTQKAISFVRQMNMYGFRKVDDCYYENDNFRRDQQHLLRNMIRRHPNKGLFVTLDHHQLAAAAAAQAQALQVNQHLLQLEQQHKQRAEQALRLSNYLNGAAHHLSQHQHQHQQANSININGGSGPNQLHQHQSSGHSPVIFHPQHPLASVHQHSHQQHHVPSQSSLHQQTQNLGATNQHHQNHNHQQAAAAAAALNAAAVMQQHQQLQQQQQQHHSSPQSHHLQSPFERMSSQLAAQMAAAQKLQLHQHQQQQLAEHIHNHHHLRQATPQSSQQQQSITNNMDGKHHQSLPLADSSNKKTNSLINTDHQLQSRNHQSAMQPKKSRLLNDFYASLASSKLTNNHDQHHEQQHSLVARAINQSQHQEDSTSARQRHNDAKNNKHTTSGSAASDHILDIMHDGDSMQSSGASSSGLESRCSSALANGSVESPGNDNNRPSAHSNSSPTATNVINGASIQHQQSLAAVLAAAAAAASTNNRSTEQQQRQDCGLPLVSSRGYNFKGVTKAPSASSFNSNDLIATNLTKQHQLHQLVSINNDQASHLENNHQNNGSQQQQALHETLVRSLLQLKHRHQHPDLLANAFHQQQHHQQQQHKSLLESLASLSSAGTGSIIDHSSDSATTERSPSPVASSNHSRDLDCDENMALNLAKSSPIILHNQHHQQQQLAVVGTTTSTGIEHKHYKQSIQEAQHRDKRPVSGGLQNNHRGPNEDKDDEDCGIDIDDVLDGEEEELRSHGVTLKDRKQTSNNDNNDIDDDQHDNKMRNNEESESIQSDIRESSKIGSLPLTSSNNNNNNNLVSCSMDQSPLDGAKKVEKFLDDHDHHHSIHMSQRRSVKREMIDNNNEHDDMKRARLVSNHDERDLDHGHEDDLELEDAEQELVRSAKRLAATQLGINWLSRTLIVQLCDRRGDKLDMEALGDAARYIECFLETLFDDAALIARHQSSSTGENSPESHSSSKDKSTSADFAPTNPIDSSSLSLALKLIPSKLMASIGCCPTDGVVCDVSNEHHQAQLVANRQKQHRQVTTDIINSSSPTTIETSQDGSDEVDICTASPSDERDEHNDNDSADRLEC